MDSSLAALVAMCVTFFVITVGALLCHLRQQDALLAKDDVIYALETAEGEWVREKEVLLSRTQELESNDTLRRHTGTGTLTHRVRGNSHAEYPALPIKERNSVASFESRSPPGLSREQNKGALRRALRTFYPISLLLRRYYGKWSRWAVSVRGGSATSAASRAKFNNPRPIEYFTPNDYSNPHTNPLGNGRNGGGVKKGSSGTVRRQPPQFATQQPNGVPMNGYPGAMGGNGGVINGKKGADLGYARATSPVHHYNQAFQASSVPVVRPYQTDVYAPGGLSGGYPYPSAIRHVEP